jgi:hypothetical protein
MEEENEALIALQRAEWSFTVLVAQVKENTRVFLAECEEIEKKLERMKKRSIFSRNTDTIEV